MIIDAPLILDIIINRKYNSDADKNYKNSIMIIEFEY